MNTRAKIRLDRSLGLPAAIALNAASRVLGRLLRRDHSIEPGNVRTIVVAKFLGMGSILQSTPLLAGLRARFPGARLVFLTSRAHRPLIERLDAVDDGLYLDDRGPLRLLGSTLQALRELLRLRVDLYFDLEVYSAFACLLAVLSCARNRLGLYRYSTRFKSGNYTHLVYFNARQPIRAIYLQLGLAAGIPASAGARLAAPRILPADRAALAARHPRLAAAAGSYVVINPNASDLLLERRWPKEHFAALIEGLSGRGLGLVLIGSRDEAPYVAELVASLSAAARAVVTDTAGTLELPGLFALIAASRAVITNDTGPMHLALSLERPAVCLFGPCSPEHYGLDRAGTAILYQRVFCSPCVHEIEEPPCAGDNVCMKLITPQAALAAFESLGGGAPDAARAAPAPARLPLLDSRGQPLGLVVRKSVPGA